MKNTFSMLLFLPLLIAMMIFSACSRKPKTQKDQLSYTIGAQFGKSLSAQKLDLDAKEVGRGIADAYKGEKLQLSEEEMDAAVKSAAASQQVDIHEQAERNKVVSDAFLAKNKDAPGVKVTASGLQYKMVEEGTGVSPKREDVAVIKYRLMFASDKEDGSSFAPTTPAELAVGGVIPGWTEGLQLMKKGGKAIFFVPPELGYGDRPQQGIPSNSVQIFQVELLDVKVANPPAAKGTTAKSTDGKNLKKKK